MRVNAFSASAAVLLVASGAFAASHRNGPLLLEDQTANLNDFYIFRSWEQGHTSSVVMSMRVPGIYLKETYVVVTRDLATGKASFYFNDVNGHVLSVAPPNTGPNGTPNYEQNLGQPSIFTLSNGMRVFAGPRDDAFYFDSGATFDYLNFRAP